MEDHAGAAIRAALAIAKVIKEDNAMRRAAGKAPIRMRIGLHSGPAVVGNIGAPGRVNFTVVGDTVNVAKRVEQLGKEFMRHGEDVVLLVSGDTLAAVKDRELAEPRAAQTRAAPDQGPRRAGRGLSAGLKRGVPHRLAPLRAGVSCRQKSVREDRMWIANAWYVAAWLHEIAPGRIHARTIIDQPIALYRTSRARSWRSRIAAAIASRRCRSAGSRATICAACITA